MNDTRTDKLRTFPLNQHGDKLLDALREAGVEGAAVLIIAADSEGHVSSTSNLPTSAQLSLMSFAYDSQLNGSGIETIEDPSKETIN